MHRRLPFILVACITLWPHAPAFAADFQRAFGLAAGDDVLWAYVRYPDPVDHELGLYFAYAGISENGTLQPWRHSGLVSIRGQIRFAVVSGSRLHVFFSDGSHVRYDTPLPGVQSTRTTERKLPMGALPLALCADSKLGTIYALVDRVVAVQMVEEQKQAQVTNKDVSATNPEPPPPAADGDIPILPDDSDYFIIRYTGARWMVDASVPKIGQTSQRWWLLSSGVSRHLLFQANTSDGLSLFAMTHGNGVWTKPQTLVLEEKQEAVDCVSVNEKPAVVTRTDTRLDLRYFDVAVTPIFLQPGGASADFFDRDLAVTNCKYGLALSTLDEQEQVWVGYWSTESGQPLLAPGPVQPLTPRRQPVIDRQLQALLSFVGLAVIMATVFARRRESILNPLPTPEGTAPATHLKRFLAFVLDAVFCSPLFLGAVYLVATTTKADLRVLFTDYSAIEPFWMRSFWLWLAACGAFVVYCTVFEFLWSATPGKRVMSCRVIRENGQPCSFAVIALRNAVRFVEFFIPFQALPVIVLVLLTRNRQRLGDLIARTIVVETLPVQGSTPDAGSTPPGSSV